MSTDIAWGRKKGKEMYKSVRPQPRENPRRGGESQPLMNCRVGVSGENLEYGVGGGGNSKSEKDAGLDAKGKGKETSCKTDGKNCRGKEIGGPISCAKGHEGKNLRGGGGSKERSITCPPGLLKNSNERRRNSQGGGMPEGFDASPKQFHVTGEKTDWGRWGRIARVEIAGPCVTPGRKNPNKRKGGESKPI